MKPTPLDSDPEWNALLSRRSFDASMSQGLAPKPPLRWRLIVGVLGFHLVVISAFLYFNSTIKVPRPPAMPVGVIFEGTATDSGTPKP